MGTTLTGTTPANTYDSLIKVTDNGPLSGTAKYLSDGLGNDSVLALSTAGVGIGTASPDAGSKLTVSGGIFAKSVITAATTDALALDYLSGSTAARIIAYGPSATNYGNTIFLRSDGTTTNESMRITSAGLVGIGTSSPTTSLDVIGSGRFKSSFGDYLLTIENIKDDSQGLLVRASDNDSTPLVKFQSSVGATSETWIDRFVVNKDGNVGIGTGSPSDKLTVAGNMTLTQTTNGTDTVLSLISRTAVGNSRTATIEYDADDERIYFKNAGTTVAVMNSAGNVGIGTDSPDAKLDITASPSAYTGALRLGVETNSSEGDSVGISFKTKIALSGSVWENARIATITESVSSSIYGALAFSTMNATTLSEKMRITPTGVVELAQGQIKFPATQVASADPNTLDDYEEGTFTATLKGGTTDPTTPVTTTANYTKIGRQVTVSISFVNVDTTGAAGAVTVSGLPFVIGVATTGAVTSEFFDFGASRTSINSYAGAGGSIIYFFASGDDVAFDSMIHNAGAGRYLYTSITYFV